MGMRRPDPPDVYFVIVYCYCKRTMFVCSSVRVSGLCVRRVHPSVRRVRSYNTSVSMSVCRVRQYVCSFVPLRPFMSVRRVGQWHSPSVASVSPSVRRACPSVPSVRRVSLSFACVCRVCHSLKSFHHISPSVRLSVASSFFRIQPSVASVRLSQPSVASVLPSRPSGRVRPVIPSCPSVSIVSLQQCLGGTDTYYKTCNIKGWVWLQRPI